MSSSPEQDFLGIHIRAVGTWTNKLYKFVDELTRAQRVTIQTSANKLRLNTPDVDVKAGERGEQDLAITLEPNTGSLDRNRNSGKDLEVGHAAKSFTGHQIQDN